MHRDSVWVKIKVAAVALLVGAAVAGGSVAAYHAIRVTPAPTPDDAVAFVPAVSPEEESGRGKAVRGLRLVLDAGGAETTIKPGAAQADPIAFRLQFRNDSDQPFKIKTSTLAPAWEKRYEITVTGPDADSVRIEEQDGPPPPASGFFHPLAPGKSKVAANAKLPGSFQGADGKLRTYSLCKPGKYVVRVRYVNTDMDDPRLAAGTWTGTVDSNDCVITVRESK